MLRTPHRTRRALLSVWDKTEEFNKLARALHWSQYQLIASGGTFKHLRKLFGIAEDDTENKTVINSSEITNLDPVLDHRVATLCPELHGGLLADEHLHMEELDRLGWPFIDMVVATFYPLAKTMEEKKSDFVAINDGVDIGGPCLIRSACKGGRIVLVDESDFNFVINQMSRGHGMRPKDTDWLQAKATAVVAQYVALESVFRINKLRPKMAKEPDPKDLIETVV